MDATLTVKMPLRLANAIRVQKSTQEPTLIFICKGKSGAPVYYLNLGTRASLPTAEEQQFIDSLRDLGALQEKPFGYDTGIFATDEILNSLQS